jgi:hypothetical protein
MPSEHARAHEYLLLLGSLIDEGFVNVGNDTTSSNGCLHIARETFQSTALTGALSLIIQRMLQDITALPGHMPQPEVG